MTKFQITARFHHLCPGCERDIFPGQSTFHHPHTETWTCEHCDQPEHCVICGNEIIGHYAKPGENYCRLCAHRGKQHLTAAETQAEPRQEPQ